MAKKRERKSRRRWCELSEELRADLKRRQVVKRAALKAERLLRKERRAAMKRHRVTGKPTLKMLPITKLDEETYRVLQSCQWLKAALDRLSWSRPKGRSFGTRGPSQRLMIRDALIREYRRLRAELGEQLETADSDEVEKIRGVLEATQVRRKSIGQVEDNGEPYDRFKVTSARELLDAVGPQCM